MTQYQSLEKQVLEIKKKILKPETIFKYLNFLISIVLISCFKGSANFHEFLLERGYHAFSLTSLVWCVISFTVILIGKGLYYRCLRNSIQNILHPKYTGEQKTRKREFVLKLSFDCVFYLLTTLSAFLLFRHEYWFPSVVGGSGTCAQLYLEYPNWPTNKRKEIQMFLMAQLGVQLYFIFEICLKKKDERKFYELFLHHMVAAALIIFVTATNQVVIGVITLFIHDFTNIFNAGGRALFETKVNDYKLLTFSIGVVLVFFWIYFRIVIYPFCILVNAYVNKPTPGDQWYRIHVQYECLLLISMGLLCMHLYWTMQILKSGMRSLIKKEIVNIRDQA